MRKEREIKKTQLDSIVHCLELYHGTTQVWEGERTKLKVSYNLSGCE